MTYREAIEKGYGFSYSTAVGGLVVAVAGVNTAPMLWNPLGSEVELHVLEIRLGFVAGAAVILSHLAYGRIDSAGGDIGGSVTSFTPGAAVGLRPTKGVRSGINFAPATLVLAAAPTYWMPSGISAPGALAAGNPVQLKDAPADGRPIAIIPPGVAFFPYMANAAMALTASVVVIGVEMPRVAA